MRIGWAAGVGFFGAVAIGMLAAREEVTARDPGARPVPAAPGFVENRGQFDPRVAFQVPSRDHSVFFTAGGHTLLLAGARGAPAHAIRVDLVDAAVDAPISTARAPGVVSQFKGSPAQWKTGIPIHSAIRYGQAWPGIDLDYRSREGRLESVYTVAPGADPARIRLRYSGQDALALDRSGNLVYRTPVGAVTETAPVLYQDIGGERIAVKGRFSLVDGRTVGFEIAAFDAAHTLVIDPTLVYSGFIGGSQSEDAFAIAADGSRNAYIAGRTATGDGSFPATAGPQPGHGGASDAFVAKVSPAGTLLYAVLIGGTGADEARAIAVDTTGNAYIAGTTASLDGSFPVGAGPDTTSNGGASDAFVAKLNPAGTALVYSGFIGGGGEDIGSGIGIDGGNAYVGGTTASTEASFPVSGGPDLSYNGGAFDAFVAKVSASGSALLYAGYVGGNDFDTAYGLAVDSSGRAVLAGLTQSTETTFAEVAGPDLTHNGTADGYVARVNAAGSALDFAGYIGGGDFDFALNVAVDGDDDAYVTGCAASTETTGFPAAGGPDLTHNGGNDVFVAKISGASGLLAWSGFIGGNSNECGAAIAVDADELAHVTGGTGSTNLPVSQGPDLTHNGGGDAFVAQLSADGSALVYAGYIGGGGDDAGAGIAVDDDGNAWVTGTTNSTATTFPVAGGPDLSGNGGNDAFITRVQHGQDGGGGPSLPGGGGMVASSLLLGLLAALRRRRRK